MDKQNMKTIDVLKLLEKGNAENYLSLYVPSLNSEVRFKPITNKQRKKFISSAVDSPITRTLFSIAFYETLEENCVDGKDVVKTFTIDDKWALAIQYRIGSIGETTKAFKGEGDDSEEKEINLKEHFDAVLKSDSQEAVSIISVLAGSFVELSDSVKLKVKDALYYDEYVFEKEFKDKRVKDFNSPQQVAELFGELFVSEVAKFIDSVWIKPEEGDWESVVDFKTLPLKDQISIIESASSSRFKSLLKHMESQKDRSNRFLSYTDASGEKWNITIDSAFFISD